LMAKRHRKKLLSGPRGEKKCNVFVGPKIQTIRKMNTAEKCQFWGEKEDPVFRRKGCTSKSGPKFVGGLVGGGVSKY